MKNKSLRLILLGLVTWLVPFIAAFAFYDRDGNLSTSYGFFKTFMVVVSSIVGSFVMYTYMKKVDRSFLRESIVIGVAWLLLNLLLDVIILVPMARLSYNDYLATIGLGYLQIPCVCIASGALLQFHSLSK